MSTAGWSPWRRLKPPVAFTPETLAETLDEGQAFGWHSLGANIWEGKWGRTHCKVRLDGDGRLECACPPGTEKETAAAAARYFAADKDWDALADQLPWRSDPVLKAVMQRWKGLRILRQPLGETLLVFLCSSTKQIVQIKQICGQLADRFGEKLPASPVRALPTWETLSALPEAALRACRLGYRARYVKATAGFLQCHPAYLEEIGALAYPAARQHLMRLPGVGGKIADCVLLYGAGRLEAFPVDVWVLRAMQRRYALHNWKPEQVAHFGRLHFGPGAGLAQQYLFSAERGGER